MTRLFNRCETNHDVRQRAFAEGTGRLLYEILDDLFDYCFPILDKIGHKLDTVEDQMFEGRAEDVVRDLSNVKQEIISYRKIIKPERSTLRLLERRVERFMPEELDLYFDDVVDAAERIWDLLDNYKEVVEALEDTNESVISHRQNDVLRLLTIISVIMLPLTLITGVFGMNVLYPGEGTARRRSGSSSPGSSSRSSGCWASSATSAGSEPDRIAVASAGTSCSAKLQSYRCRLEPSPRIAELELRTAAAVQPDASVGVEVGAPPKPALVARNPARALGLRAATPGRARSPGRRHPTSRTSPFHPPRVRRERPARGSMGCAWSGPVTSAQSSRREGTKR